MFPCICKSLLNSNIYSIDYSWVRVSILDLAAVFNRCFWHHRFWDEFSHLRNMSVTTSAIRRRSPKSTKVIFIVISNYNLSSNINSVDFFCAKGLFYEFNSCLY